MTGIDAPAAPRRRRLVRRAELLPYLFAGGTWLVLAGIGDALRPHLAAKAMTTSVQVLPLALGLTLVLLGAVYVWRTRPTAAAAGAMIGAVGGWVTFSLLVILSGTPYGIGGTIGDCGRSLAAAERFTTTWHSADQFLYGLPSQYPPLYVWAWGRFASFRGLSAWQVMGTFQALAVGAGVVVVGLAWHWVLRSWNRALVATALTAAALLSWAGYDPCKPHESIAFLVGVPLLLGASQRMERTLLTGRVDPVGALVWGAALGVLLTLYQIPVLFGVPPLVLLWIGKSIRTRRWRAPSAHLAIAATGAAATSAWYLVPFASAALAAHSGPRATDLTMVLLSLTSFNTVVSAGWAVTAIAVLGLGLLAVNLASPAGQAMAAIFAGSLAVQALAAWNLVAGGESFYSYKVLPWITVLLASAPVVLRWPRSIPLAALAPRAERTVPAALVLVLAWPSVYSYWSLVHAPLYPIETASPQYTVAPPPGTKSLPTAERALAYRTTLPNCERVRGFPATLEPQTCFPADSIQACIESRIKDSSPVITLAYDERISAYFPNYLALPTNSGATGPLDDWNARYAWVQQLAATRDPEQFRRLALDGPFGPVRVFVLTSNADGALNLPVGFYYRTEIVKFDPSQFASADWTTCRYHNIFVAVTS